MVAQVQGIVSSTCSHAWETLRQPKVRLAAGVAFFVLSLAMRVHGLAMSALLMIIYAGSALYEQHSRLAQQMKRREYLAHLDTTLAALDRWNPDTIEDDNKARAFAQAVFSAIETEPCLRSDPHLKKYALSIAQTAQSLFNAHCENRNTHYKWREEGANPFILDQRQEYIGGLKRAIEVLRDHRDTLQTLLVEAISPF